MPKKKKITKRERNSIISVLLGIFAYSFLETPIKNIALGLGLGDAGMILIGVGLVVGIYYLLDL